MKSYTVSEIKGRMEEITRRVTENGEHIQLVLEDGRSAVLVPREHYERWTTLEAESPQDEA